ncbi:MULTISPECIES: DUF4145 domain-containing protein [unclassified Leptospira]|uniref:DUF4145 domain-containing protein n=1 Tax=unclassified Leptospira TaxID=2633828 RepID=UPI0002928CC9|nr:MULTISPECIES: DUF4145 domain-containing protein [unclassified Leptospira]EKO79971.1 PF13643 domain protein [Leptospira sp. Fiocruz LV3954]EMI69249.1 PF13643 domain protein [Leptospira sp. Fiocruz LV4135]
MRKDNSGEELLLLALGGLIGAAMAQPKKAEKNQFEYFKNYEEEFNYYLSIRNHFFEFINNKDNFFHFQNFLKEVKIKNEKLRPIKRAGVVRNDKILQSLLREAQTAYIYGMARATVILSSTALEYILRKKYKECSFNEAIENLLKEKIIKKTHYHFLHGLRSERNEHVHESPDDYGIEDAEMIINLTISLIDVLL